jgi:hypothetical protein
MPTPNAIAAELKALVGDPAYGARTLDATVFEPYSARESARALAQALDLASDPRRRRGT